MFLRWYFLVSCAFSLGYAHITRTRKFPNGFLWGAATSAYQTEGAWNIDGKGPSIWDEFVHRVPSPISNNDTGDIACDSYHKYKDDVRNAFNLGLDFYRISISWPRIFPTGRTNKINELGFAFYRNVVNEILRYNMTPVVTLYHWDLPQKLHEEGIGWLSVKLVDRFVDYARVVIKRFPEVGRWITINEPKQVCHYGYGSGAFAPGVESDGLLEYQCAYVLMKVHAATYRMYKKEFPNYKAKMSIVVDCQWAEPLTQSREDREAQERIMQFECGMYLHPVFKGDWPQLVKDRIAQRAKSQNLSKSPLPNFSQEEINFIRGTHDYLGVNHYYSFSVSNINPGETGFSNYEYDIGVVQSKSPRWRLESNSWAIVPWGVRKVLYWLKQQFNGPEILITEMGMTDDGKSVNDDDRIDFYTEYCCNILDAIYLDKVKVLGVTAWSLMDNFEWTEGYRYFFGMYRVDALHDPSLRRLPKKSVSMFQQMARSNELRCDKPHRQWPMIFSHKRRGKNYH